MAAVLKTAVARECHRGFESHTLRSPVTTAPDMRERTDGPYRPSADVQPQATGSGRQPVVAGYTRDGGSGISAGESVHVRGHARAPLMRWLAISSSPSTQLAYTRRGHGMTSPARHRGAGTPAFSNSDTAAWRRS